MKFSRTSTLQLIFTACTATIGTNASADWAVHPDPMVITAAPKAWTTQVANPPVFSWPRHSSNPPSYVLEIKNGSTVYKTYTATRNWLLPSEALADGTYTWRVRPSNNATAWTDPRYFYVNSLTARFVVPDDAALRSQIAAKARPRAISTPPYSAWPAALKLERGAALTRLKTEIDWATPRLAIPKDSDWALTSTTTVTAQTAAQIAAVRQAIFANGRQLEAASLLYRLTGEQKYLTETLVRGDALAALDVNGATSYISQDQGTRVIALSLAKAYDALNDALDSTRKAKWLSIIDQRTTVIYNDLSNNAGRMDQYPFDSHGGTNLAYVALIATLTIGDITNATKWFDFSFRASVASTSVWSGPEGGYANGTSYAQYSAEIFQQLWQPLLIATGVDMFSKPWSVGFMRFLAHFVPPGQKRHLFGDEQELVPTGYVFKGYAANISTAQAYWYYKTVPGEMEGLKMLQAPYPLPVTKAPGAAVMPNAGVYPSIGWVAMHSSMADLNRTSLYFKSSPYGSYNHSHADQNSFVLMKSGNALLAQSGYSDYFGSPNAANWYRQTKAHNAITFDGGKGQITDGYTQQGYNRQKMFGGKITAFSTTSTLDYAEGDATPTYGGALNSAIRKVWYLRTSNAAVIMDKLVAPTAVKYEWNFHAFSPMAYDSATKKVTVASADATERVCLRPITPASVNFEKRQALVAPKAGTVEDHGAFVSPAPVTSQEFLILLDVGCKNPAVQLTATASGRTLKVGTQTLALPN